MKALAPNRAKWAAAGSGVGIAVLLALLPARAETLTIATYNVENYVAADRMTESGFRRDYPKPEIQKHALRQVIRVLNADIVVLQEMGGEPYLEELRRDLVAAGLDYPHRILLQASDPDRHLAVLSKKPFSEVTRHTSLSFPYFDATEITKRGLLELHVASAAGDLTIYGLHLKSRYTDRPDDPRSELRRLGEATVIRDTVLARFPPPDPARFVILGDFNDDKASKVVKRMLRRGSVTVARLLPVADSRGDTWTHRYRRADSYTRVDHILVSPALHSAVREGRASIYDGPGTSEASDHRPVVMTLILPDNK